MAKKITLTHSDIQTYLKGQADARIIMVREENPQLKLLCDLVDQIKTQVFNTETITAVNVPQSFTETEEILSDLLAGSITAENKQNFLGALFHSADFYHKVLLKLGDFGKIMEEKIPAEMEQVAIKSDEDLITEMGMGKELESATQFEEKSKLKIGEIAEKLFGWLIPIPRYAYAAAAVAVGFIIIISGSTVFYLASTGTQEDDIFAEYVYVDKVPYEYDVSSFRGGETELQGDPTLYSFVNQFKLGISDYMLNKYKDAIKTFEAVIPVVDKIVLESNNKDYIILKHDLYFYLGLSQLAQSRTAGLKKDESEQMLSQSINSLSIAEAIAKTNILDKINRDIYYFALASALKGQIDIATLKLNQIKVGSTFYKKSITLLEVISKI